METTPYSEKAPGGAEALSKNIDFATASLCEPTAGDNTRAPNSPTRVTLRQEAGKKRIAAYTLIPYARASELVWGNAQTGKSFPCELLQLCLETLSEARP